LRYERMSCVRDCLKTQNFALFPLIPTFSPREKEKENPLISCFLSLWERIEVR